MQHRSASQRRRPDAVVGLAPKGAEAALYHGVAEAVVRALDSAGLAICVCDEADTIRFANALFRERFLPRLGDRTLEFAIALYESAQAGEGLRLDSMPLDAFIARIRRRRRTMTGSVSFVADTAEGRWLTITDTKLPNGWLVAIGQDITALKSDELKLRADHASVVEQANTDFLTGVPNRRHGFTQATALFAERQAAGGGVALCLLDIDHFKQVNDRYGHDAGDRVLAAFARHVAGSIGPRHLFCRSGGEEFLLVSPETEPMRLKRMVGRVLGALAPIAVDSAAAPLRITASGGIAASRPCDDWADVLKRADGALYMAKSRGRDRVEVARAAD